MKDLNSKNDFLRKQIDQYTSKNISLEKIIIDMNSQTETLKENIHNFELKIARQKTKRKLEKQEKNDLIEKLGEFVDKDNIHKNLIRNKNDDFEKFKISTREKEKDFKIQITSLQKENSADLEKISDLNQEISRLNDILELYNSSNNKMEIEPNPNSKNYKTRMLLTVDNNKKESALLNKKNISTAVYESSLLKSQTKKTDTDNKELELLTQQKTQEPTKEKKDNKINEGEERNLETNPNLDKKPPNLLFKKKTSIKLSPYNEIIDKKESLMKFLDAFFNDKGPDKTKLFNMFDKLSRKIKKHPNSDNLLLLIENLLDRKETPNIEKPKISLVKQQEMLIQKNREEHPRQNLKPVTIIKEIISSPIKEDPIYEEFLKWKEENNLDKMIEIIKKKVKFLERLDEKQFGSQKNMSRTMTNGFSNLINSNEHEKTLENPEKNDISKTDFIKIMPRLMTSDEIHRKKTNYNEQKPKIKKPQYQNENFDHEKTDFFNNTDSYVDKLERDDFNFSKKKFFYKYPFKTINFKFQKENTNKSEDKAEKFFENLYRKLVLQHERCGSNCGHLKKFYQRISFVNKYLQKEEVQMNKNVIDRLPYFNEEDVMYLSK